MLADEIVKGRFTQCVVAVPIKRIFTKKKKKRTSIYLAENEVQSKLSAS